jgi:hypothetical protein
MFLMFYYVKKANLRFFGRAQDERIFLGPIPEIRQLRPCIYLNV